MTVVRRIGHCSPRSPQSPESSCRIGLIRSQHAARRKSQFFKSAGWVEAGLGEFVTNFVGLGCGACSMGLGSKRTKPPGRKSRGLGSRRKMVRSGRDRFQIRAGRGSGRSRNAQAGAATC
jgi:hypothetical protein